jgi:glycosyltransferase involved in cell wall biosynthesis
VTVHRVPFTGITDGPGRARMARFLVDSGAQLLHVHNRPQDWQIVTLAALLGIPAIYTVHSPYAKTKAIHRLIYGAVGRWVPRVICVSRTVADQTLKMHHLPEGGLQVIYNGIRMDLFVPPVAGDQARDRLRAEMGFTGDSFGWVCCARLADLKGQGFLLDAMAALPQRSRSRLALAGDGPLEASLKDQAARLGLGERVRFLGSRRDVPALLAAADGYACASQVEGHPLSLLEAMATMRPVVAPRLPAIREIATDGAPLLYGPTIEGKAETHDPAEIAAALLQVEDAPERYAAYARASREHVSRTYSREVMLDRHEEVYRSILGDRARRRGSFGGAALAALTRVTSQLAMRDFA